MAPIYKPLHVMNEFTGVSAFLWFQPKVLNQ